MNETGAGGTFILHILLLQLCEDVSWSQGTMRNIRRDPSVHMYVGGGGGGGGHNYTNLTSHPWVQLSLPQHHAQETMHAHKISAKI